MSDRVFQSVKSRWQEVMELPPQTMGPLTPLYKRVVPYFKTHPWRVLIVLSLLAAMVVSIPFDVLLIRLVSVLQRGF